MLTTAVGFAADSEHPNMDHGTANKAQVSEDVDTALNITPKMGDVGIDQKTLFEALLVAGGCYLVSDGVATVCKKSKKKETTAANPA